MGTSTIDIDIMTSTNYGKSWVGQKSPGVERNRWEAVCFGNGVFIAVALTGTNRVSAPEAKPPLPVVPPLDRAPLPVPTRA